MRQHIPGCMLGIRLTSKTFQQKVSIIENGLEEGVFISIASFIKGRGGFNPTTVNIALYYKTTMV